MTESILKWPALAATAGLVTCAACAPAGDQAAQGTSAAEVRVPEPRGYTQLVYHPASGQIFMFGGESNHRTSLEDTWTYDAGSDRWSEVPADPHPVDAGGRAAAYDAESDRIIVYYTTLLDRSAEGGLRRIGETWAFDPARGTWTNMRPDPMPFGLMGARLAYDAAADRVILFGGADFTRESAPRFHETWAYDFNTNTWTRRSPETSPPGRSYFGMVYDAGAGKVLIYGGSFAPEDSAAAGELRAYDYAADRWDRVAYSGSAPPDHHPAMAYASRLHRSFYLVGTSFSAFDYASRTWTGLPLDDGLGDRHFHGMAFDEAAGRLVLFGGGSRGLHYDNETWIYDPSSSRWRRGGAPQ